MAKGSRLAFDFIESASVVREARQLNELLLAAIEPFGLTGFIMGALTRSADRRQGAIALCAWPLAWYQRYVREGYLNWDPVARHARATAQPFLWSEIGWDSRNDRNGRRVMEEARQFGLEDGLVVPVPGVGGEHNAVSLGGRPRPLEPSMRQALQLMCIYAHHRAKLLAQAGTGALGIGPSGAMLDRSAMEAGVCGPALTRTEIMARAAFWWSAPRGPPAPLAVDNRSPSYLRSTQRLSPGYDGPHLRQQPQVVVHTVTAENRHLYEAELAQSRRLFSTPGAGCRPLISVPRQSSPADPGPAPIHLLAIERASRRVQGAIQLMPTLRSVEPARRIRELAWLEWPVPRDPNVFQWCGYEIATSSCEGSKPMSVAAVLAAGLQEYCLKENIEQLVTVASVHSLGILLELGWNPEPLGLPRPSGNGSLIAIMLDISEYALQHTRVLLDVPGPVVVRRKIRHSATPPVSVPRLH